MFRLLFGRPSKVCSAESVQATDHGAESKAGSQVTSHKLSKMWPSLGTCQNEPDASRAHPTWQRWDYPSNMSCVAAWPSDYTRSDACGKPPRARHGKPPLLQDARRIEGLVFPLQLFLRTWYKVSCLLLISGAEAVLVNLKRGIVIGLPTFRQAVCRP